MFEIIDSFIDGEITDIQCQHCLSATNLGMQYVFVSEKALSQITLLERCYLTDLAKRMDQAGFLFELLDIPDAINEIEIQYGASTYGKEKFSNEEMHWIGYIYRYWAYINEKSSKEIYKIMKPEQLRKLYFPYHSLDPLQAIDRMKEEADPVNQNDLDDISRGVIALRKVRNKYK